MFNFDGLLSEVTHYPIKKVAIAAAQDHTVIEAALKAQKEGIAEHLLLGDEEEIKGIAEDLGLDINGVPLIHYADEIHAKGGRFMIRGERVSWSWPSCDPVYCVHSASVIW